MSNTLSDCGHDAINETAGNIIPTCRYHLMLIVSLLVSVLVDFYCERLTDKTCVPNLLEGLEALTTFSNFSGKNAVFVSKR